MTDLTSDRRVSGRRLAQLLGAWRRPGPAYTALADALRAAVLSGSVPIGTRLPSERELATAVDVSRTTTTACYDVLRVEGYLTSRRGSGTVTTLPGAEAVPFPRVTATDDEVVDLTIAAPSAPSALHPAYLAALDELPRHLAGTGYHPLGLPVLRQAVADMHTARGAPTSPEQVLVTTGAQQAISLLVSTLSGPGERVVVEQPTYPHAIESVRAAGARPVAVPSGDDGLDVELLESTIRQSAPRLVYLIPDHRNPTGTSLSSDDRSRVRAIARRHRTTVVADEALTELTLDGAAPEPFSGDGTASGHVVAIGSMSKSYWGGLRVGWVRAHPDLVARLATTRARIDIATPVLEQLVAAHLLKHDDGTLDRRRAELRARRDALVGLLRTSLPEWRVPVPAGGLCVWADLGAPVSSALAALGVRHGVRVAPGPSFGVGGSLEDRLRLPFSRPVDELRRAVDALASAWAVLDPTDTAPAAARMVV
ncbi:PLP-dependent aminotransferase family protein [Cellulomonas sp. HZM]|uniref:MocR-like transcription factor YczR n=1 Tax=Cellulomonas sp. HZM TaxID=1454010 RepID=UPI000552BBAE|nr:PLP-dependent aminotransferase family protein [Cellulomonas sp. HZM]